MTLVPPVIPVATPLPPTIVATPVEPLLQVPKGVVLVSVVVDPWQTTAVPPMAAGRGLTVTTVVL